MRVLVVEDAPRLQRAVAAALRHAGYAVDVAGDGEEGLWLAQANAYDAVVLDWMLPKRDGLTVLRRLRESGQETHVLMLTARDTVADRVTGLQGGADDYLVKPFALEELLARVEALCRRAYGRKSSRLEVGPLVLDTAAKRAFVADAPLELSAREYSLLEYLARRAGEVVPRHEIEAHLYDERVDPMSNVVDSAICLLRKKLGTPLIHTRRGQGYVLAVSPAP
ncbi:response regulator transcription factor [Opitutus sp. ER46]|uniref:response regulator transcription factor n=1 Tax=Opitutus sp. ER46 TaxID=2161864 RepID=UPI000D2F79A1|nr:response regulator transcription factor [Opitutus sp. ER46]PTX99080.1 DNA-binding response regulator [Opitutus sp. ER46]